MKRKSKTNMNNNLYGSECEAKTFLEEVKRERLFICCILFLTILLFVVLSDLMLDFSFSSVLCIIVLIIDVVLIIKHQSHKKEVQNSTFFDSDDLIQQTCCKYNRRAINWTFLFFICLSDSICRIIEFSFESNNLHPSESYNLILNSIRIVSFFVLENIFLTRYIINRTGLDGGSTYIKRLIKVIAFSILYWVLAFVVFYLFESIFVTNPYFVLALIYFIIMLVYNYKLNKISCYPIELFKKKTFVLVFLVCCSFALYAVMSRDIWLLQSYINSVPNISRSTQNIEYNQDSGIYTITNNKDNYKILQLTDIHLGGSITSYSKDLKALETVCQLIEFTQPDLVVVTGDLTYPVGLSSFSFNNTTPVQEFAAFMRNIGIPWAFAYGNHDTEKMAANSASDLNNLYMSLSYKTSKTLLYPYIQPAITGRNNQLIELRNQDGRLNQAIFLIDSNAYMGKGFSDYDYIRDDQVDWYRDNILRLDDEEGENISSLVFFHMPLQEYETAFEKYLGMDPDVNNFFGEKLEKISSSEHQSKMFDTAVELGSTKGFFCGHDHFNNISLEYKGIRLTYGMSIDYLVSPGISRKTAQRGGTLITIHEDSSIDIEQVPYSEISQ